MEHNNTNKHALRDKGGEELKFLMEKNNSDVEKITAKYQQFADPLGELPPQIVQMRNGEVHEHQNKVSERRASLENKVGELLAESEVDHKKKFLKMEKHHHKRRAELELAIRKLSGKFQAMHEQLKYQRIKNHEKKYMKIQEDIQKHGSTFHLTTPKEEGACDSGGGGGSGSGSGSGGEHEVHQSSSGDYQVGAAVRQKRRKSLLTRSFIPTFMTVEIHNEGLYVSCRNESLNAEGAADPATNDLNKEPTISNDFIPWGFVARGFLYSIVCGDIPDHGIIGETLAGRQGQIKCIVADLRAAADTAVLQRERAKQSGNMEELSQLEAGIKTTLTNDIQAEIVCKEKLNHSEREVDMANQQLKTLRSKTQKYLNKDGGLRVDNTNENFKQLSQIFSKCEGEVKTAEHEHKLNSQKATLARAKRIRTAEEYKKILQELSHAQKFESREMESREYSENDSLASFLSIFHKVASERRSQGTDSKRTRSVL